jgi:hypothetical protein
VDVRETGEGLLKLREEEGSNPPVTDVSESCNEALLNEDDRVTRPGEGVPIDAGDAAMFVDDALRGVRGDEAAFIAVAAAVVVVVVAVKVGEVVIVEVVDIVETGAGVVVVVVVGDGVQSCCEEGTFESRSLSRSMPILGVEGWMCGWGGCCDGMLLEYVRCEKMVVVL